jgi:hypothetical protein
MEIDNAREVIAQLKLTAKRIEAQQARMLYRAGSLVQREAKKNAPKSPTMQELENRSTGTQAQRDAGKRRRNDRSTSRPSPGGLEQSIEMRSNAMNAEIFVAANSSAGRYAWRIHEEKGKTWWKRGKGTQAKGARADDKFIERALADNTENLRKIAESQVEKAIQEANR